MPVPQTNALDPPDVHGFAGKLSEASDEPVVPLDAGRVPCWANHAAHALHGINDASELDAPMDEDLRRFEVCRLGSRRGCGGADGAEPQVTRSDGQVQRIRMKESALIRGGHVFSYAMALGAADAVGVVKPATSLPLCKDTHASVLVRCSDRVVTWTNEAFLGLTGHRGSAVARSSAALGIPAILLAGQDTIRFPTLSRLETANGRPAETVLVDAYVEILDGEEFRLLTFSRLDPQLTASVLEHSLEEGSRAVADLICGTVAAPVFVLDAEQRVISASEEMLRLLSYSSCEFVGRSIMEFLSEASVRSLKNAFWPSLSDCSLAEDASCELVTSKGSKLRVRLIGRAVLDKDQAVRRVTCVVQDLTERDLSETKFSTLFALSPTPMLVRRLDTTRILDANPAFLSMTGHAADAVIGRSMEELTVFEPSHLRQRFERDLRAGLPVRAAEMRIRTHDGPLLEMKATAAAVQASGHGCALVVLHDTVHGRFDEQQLFKAIETVMSDTSWFSREVVEKLATVRMPRAPSIRHGELDDLTKREHEVLAMISHGWSDADIAAKLSLSRSTVRNHVAALYSKIGVHSRSSAIVWARERALNVMHPAAGFGQQASRRATSTNPQVRHHHG